MVMLRSLPTSPTPPQSVSPPPSVPVAGNPGLTLEICRGRTRFPYRPVSGMRFFIGTGANCDLCLGGTDLPAIHSLIQVRGSHYWIERLASEPMLRINGGTVQGEWLRDGDLLEIGPFKLAVHFTPAAPLPAPEFVNSDLLAPVELPPDVDTPAFDPAQLSAAQLANLIEQEEALVAEFETNQRTGADALLQALRARHEDQRTLPAVTLLVTPAPPSEEERELLKELTELARELRNFADELEHAAGASAVLSLQPRLVGQLRTLSERLSRWQHPATGQGQPTRAIA